MKIEIVIEKTATGFSAYASKYSVFTTGETIEEVLNNMVEAMNLYLEDSGKKVSRKDITMVLDIPQFFNYYKVINAKALSERIGINQSLLSQYITGNKKPSAAQKQRILKGIHQLGKELISIEAVI